MLRRRSRTKLRSSGAEDGSSLISTLLATAAVSVLLVFVAATGRVAIEQLQLASWASEAAAAAAGALGGGPAAARAAGQDVLASGPPIVAQASSTWVLTTSSVRVSVVTRVEVGPLGVVSLSAVAEQRGP